ncbi:MAG: UDP-3-O-(3-hydroxymyristoyl)glucosamine N-acyltransferase [Elusimicrobia bacterium]|nr:UDP-3-O-(3-hydroxymyristoyl)glucosamine N-acyltransferase [Elusimicrobiota bacterium]
MVRLKEAISAGWLCRELGLTLVGPDREIQSLCSLEALSEGGLSFLLPGHALPALTGGTMIGQSDACGIGVSLIASPSPRLDFIRAQYLLRERPGFLAPAEPPALHPAVVVGPGAVIENGVAIGEGTVIGANAVIRAGTRIGRHCEVKACAVIGDSGFGFERDAEKRPIRMIHLGGVRIGDFVEVGALTTVVRGALGDTILEDYVKVNDHVHIAHNCRIGRGTMIGACADLSGSLDVGENCWIAPNCSIRQKLVIGPDSTIGIGAVVVRDVPAGSKVYGNPAKPH